MTRCAFARSLGPIGLLLLVVSAAPVWAQDFNVTGFRTDRVTLYRDCKMDQGVVVTKQEFKGPWPARQDPGSSLYYRIVRDGVTYCVKAFQVSTDRTIEVPKDAQCTGDASAMPKAGSARGLGGVCGDMGPPAGTPGARPTR